MRTWTRQRTLLLPLAVLALLCLPGVASADTSISTNWSGYAAHGKGASFSRVAGSWIVPSANCATTSPAYSATWIGLGGYAVNSPALEQIGTETDCNRSGRVTATAWYELVPAPSHNVALTVSPGDQMTSTVSVTGHRVTLTLQDRTRHRSFTKTVTVASVDTSSAEWIVEAPSECLSTSQCATLPLADFSPVNFTGAQAKTKSGRLGSIANGSWSSTKITMAARGRTFVLAGGGGLASAVPSALTNSGTAFSVAYSQSVLPQPPGTTPVYTTRTASRRAAAG